MCVIKSCISILLLGMIFLILVIGILSAVLTQLANR